MHAPLTLFPAERGERLAHCTAQNKPKRFKQTYFSVTATRTRASTFFSNLTVPHPKGQIVLITDASDVGGGGTIYQCQELNPAELTHCHYRTSGLNRDGSLRRDYPTSELRLVPPGHWNWKWKQARSNYSTHDQELLAGILVLSSQSRLLGSNPIREKCR